MSKYTIWILVAAGLLMASPASAQSPSEAEAADAPAADAAPVAEAPTTDPVAEAALVAEEAPAEEEVVEEPKEKLDPNDPLYWAKIRGIYTIQKRAFQKEGRVSATVYGGMIPNNIFERYYPVGLRLDYYVLENLGVELATSYAFKSATGLEEQLKEASGTGAQQVLVGDTQLSHTNFGVVWSPFFGKTAFHNTALNYFDLYVFAGVGLVITETVPDFNADAEVEPKPEGALGAGMAYYLGESAVFRADYRQFVFAKVGDAGVAKSSEVSLGLGWFF